MHLSIFVETHRVSSMQLMYLLDSINMNVNVIWPVLLGHLTKHKRVELIVPTLVSIWQRLKIGEILLALLCMLKISCWFEVVMCTLGQLLIVRKELVCRWKSIRGALRLVLQSVVSVWYWHWISFSFGMICCWHNIGVINWRIAATFFASIWFLTFWSVLFLGVFICCKFLRLLDFVFRDCLIFLGHSWLCLLAHWILIPLLKLRTVNSSRWFIWFSFSTLKSFLVFFVSSDSTLSLNLGRF
jgi:hypothetical protein